MSSHTASNTVADLRYVHQGPHPSLGVRATLPSGSALHRRMSMPQESHFPRVSVAARSVSVDAVSCFSTPRTGPLGDGGGFKSSDIASAHGSGFQELCHAATSASIDARTTMRPVAVSTQSATLEVPGTRQHSAPPYETYRIYSDATLNAILPAAVQKKAVDTDPPSHPSTEQRESYPFPDSSRHMPTQMAFAESSARQSASNHSYRLQPEAAVVAHAAHSITKGTPAEPLPHRITSQIMRDPTDLAAHSSTAKSLLMIADAERFNHAEHGTRPARRISGHEPENTSSTYFGANSMAAPCHSEHLEEDVNLRVVNLVGLPSPPSSVFSLGTSSYRVRVLSAEGKQLGTTPWVESDGGTVVFPEKYQVIQLKTRAAKVRALVEAQGAVRNITIGWLNLHRLDSRSTSQTCYAMESENGAEIDVGGLTCIFEENPMVNSGLDEGNTAQTRVVDEHGVVCVLEIDKVTHLPAPSMLQQSNVSIRVFDQNDRLLTTLGPFPVKPQPENASKRCVSVQQQVGVKGPLYYYTMDGPRGPTGTHEGTMLLRLEVGYLANIGHARTIGTCNIVASWTTQDTQTVPFGNGCTMDVTHVLMHEKQWMVKRSQPPATSNLPAPAGDLHAESPVKPVMPAPSMWDIALHRVKGKSLQEELKESMIRSEYVATRVRDKVAESVEPVATFRERMGSARRWPTLDALFKSLGPSPVSNCEIYGPQLCRSAVSMPAPFADNDSTMVTLDNVEIRQRVTRRAKDWKWGDDDGGAGNVGTIFHVDRTQQVCGVEWDNGTAHTHYRLGKNFKHDLARVHTGADRMPIPWAAHNAAQLQGIFQHGKPEPHYLPMSKLPPDSTDAVKYASYRKERDAKLCFADVVTEYRSKEDIWAASSQSKSRDKSELLVPEIRYVKDDCIMA